FYEKALNQKDFEAASKYFGPRYVQHNPTAPDGIEGFKGFLGFLREKFPDSHSEIKRAFADGDYVILHVHSVREKGSRGRAIVERTVEAWGRLDILVNNVGITGPRGDAVEVDAEAWDHAMRVNVTSMMLMAKAALPQMIRGGGGSIINLTSVAGLVGGHPSL